MKIKVTNGYFEMATTKETALLRLRKSNKLPPKVSYRLAKVGKELTELNKLYLEEKQGIIERWCDRNEDGSVVINNGLILFTEHAKDFNEELIELLNIESELTLDKVDLQLDKVPEGVINSFDFPELELFIDFIE